jgi:F420-0:gamma-glutamyl ligase-like protein
MASYTIVNPGNLASGQKMVIEDILNNFQAIQAVVNGGIDDSNIAGVGLAKVPTLVYNQVAPSASWTIAHNLGKYPSVEIVDSGGTVIIPDVVYVDLNTITASFASPTSGKAYLN